MTVEEYINIIEKKQRVVLTDESDKSKLFGIQVDWIIINKKRSTISQGISAFLCLDYLSFYLLMSCHFLSDILMLHGHHFVELLL